MRLILATLLLAGPAFADDDPISIGTEAGWQLLGGLTTGGSFGDQGGGGYLGAELSLNRLSHGWWMGLYADGVYEFSQAAPYTTAGLQLGHMILGVDGGIALRGGDDAAMGYSVRAMIALAMFELYGRTLIFGADDLQTQIGILLKLPFWASE